MLTAGDRIKDYEVIAPLRSGGMAMLYLARRRGFGGFSRLVALKLVHRHLLADETILRLFLDEARISATVAHPNVVNVEEVGKSGGDYYLAMEYVHGVSLAELLSSLSERRLRMTPQLCVWVVAQVAEALHAAHEAKSESGSPLCIVHRDVSPQNVLIAHTGHVKLIDFGIANSQMSGPPTTGRTLLGKLGYMAPEQLRIEPADRRTDVYALGVMLWEMLTSRNLFRGRNVDDERDWKTRESPPPPSCFAEVPSELDRVVQKAIAYDASDRYQTAFELRSALLKADASAAKVDAPMFAALMRTLLGDELERRRAFWPDEVSAQLDVEDDSEVTVRRSWSLEELTTGLLACDPREVVEEEGSPTCIDSPAALRASGLLGGRDDRQIEVEQEEGTQPTMLARRSALARGDSGRGIRMLDAPALSRLLATPRQAEIATIPSPVSQARPPSRLARLFGVRARLIVVAVSCVLLGTWMGRHVAPRAASAAKPPSHAPALSAASRVRAVQRTPLGSDLELTSDGGHVVRRESAAVAAQEHTREPRRPSPEIERPRHRREGRAHVRAHKLTKPRAVRVRRAR